MANASSKRDFISNPSPIIVASIHYIVRSYKMCFDFKGLCVRHFKIALCPLQRSSLSQTANSGCSRCLTKGLDQIKNLFLHEASVSASSTQVAALRLPSNEGFKLKHLSFSVAYQSSTIVLLLKRTFRFSQL